MRRACAQHESGQQLGRWLAEAYWYLSDFVPAHINYADFLKTELASYYKTAAKRLWDLRNRAQSFLIERLPGQLISPGPDESRASPDPLVAPH